MENIYIPENFLIELKYDEGVNEFYLLFLTQRKNEAGNESIINITRTFNNHVEKVPEERYSKYKYFNNVFGFNNDSAYITPSNENADKVLFSLYSKIKALMEKNKK